MVNLPLNFINHFIIIYVKSSKRNGRFKYLLWKSIIQHIKKLIECKVQHHILKCSAVYSDKYLHETSRVRDELHACEIMKLILFIINMTD